MAASSSYPPPPQSSPPMAASARTSSKPSAQALRCDGSSGTSPEEWEERPYKRWALPPGDFSRCARQPPAASATPLSPIREEAPPRTSWQVSSRTQELQRQRPRLSRRVRLVRRPLIAKESVIRARKLG